jgi:hypothetical protein
MRKGIDPKAIAAEGQLRARMAFNHVRQVANRLEPFNGCTFCMAHEDELAVFNLLSN